MRLVLSFFFLTVVVFLLLIVSQNQHLLSDRLVLVLDLSYMQFRFQPVRIDLLLIAVFAAGFSLATVVGTPSRVKGALERRKLRKQVQVSSVNLPVPANSVANVQQEPTQAPLSQK